MKKLLFLLPITVLLLSACATTGFLGFLATTSYVKGKVAQSTEQTFSQLDKTRADLEKMRADVERFQQLTGQVEGLLSEIARTQKATEELQQLAKEVEMRLAELPAETLQELVNLIQAYLDSKKNSP